MYEVDEGHGQRGGDVEERDGQQHQSGRRLGRRLVGGGGGGVLRRRLHWRTGQLVAARSARTKDSANDHYVEDDRGDRRDEVERHLGRPHEHFHGRRHCSLAAYAINERVAVAVERGDQQASSNRRRRDL